MHPAPQGGVNGTSTGPISKPMDKPPKQYTSNETVPRDNFHSEPSTHSVENPGDRSKRFMP